MSAERTKGPWRVSSFEQGAGGSDRVIMGADNYAVAYLMDRTSSGNERNAAAIVRWENHFDDLVRALEEIVLRGRRLVISTKGQYVYSAEAEIAFAALAKVKS